MGFRKHPLNGIDYLLYSCNIQFYYNIKFLHVQMLKLIWHICQIMSDAFLQLIEILQLYSKIQTGQAFSSHGMPSNLYNGRCISRTDSNSSALFKNLDGKNV